MKKLILLFCFSVLIINSSFASKKAEIKDIEGLIFFRYISDSRITDCFCDLKDKIMIDSVTYDFIEYSRYNSSIIEENPELVSFLGDLRKFKVDYEVQNAFKSPARFKDKPKKYKTLIDKYRKQNIFDKDLFNCSIQKSQLFIKSNSIYQIGISDTLCIPIRFRGRVIIYDDLVFGPQSDYRSWTDENGKTHFENGHSLCPFEKFDSSIVVLLKVDRLQKIAEKEIEKYNLRKSPISEIRIVYYE